MAAFASGDASISARRHAAERLLRLGKGVQVECGDISTSQEDLLAGTPFLSGGGEEPEEVFSTPPLTHAPQSQGQGEEQGEDDITMCTLPFTQPPSPSSPPPSSERAASKPRKPRVCIRKVRGARIRTPTPSPDGRRGTSGGGGSAHDSHRPYSPHRIRGHPRACSPTRHLLIAAAYFATEHVVEDFGSPFAEDNESGVARDAAVPGGQKTEALSVRLLRGNDQFVPIYLLV
ncbi:hypothetical protein U9M48_025993 [Paspalum notatum var. saurae]|uniref:Uncharacterized protein n=1 Tax=Paspalum notatum var. saurae TaxID=547442 RepID=A0AAQ3WYC3_PASNO